MMKTLLGKRGRAALFAMGASAGAIIVLLVYALTTTAVNSSETNERGESRESQIEANDETLKVIKDCTQIGGKCYERGQRQTAAILSSAQRIIILSAACSVDVSPAEDVDTRIAAITDCVVARLAKPTAKP